MIAMNNQIEIEELNCQICQEQYDDSERNPRILLCGHTYCTRCLRSLLQEDDPLCPECRFYIDELTVESLPVCYIVKKIVDSIKVINGKIVRNCINVLGSEGKENDGDFPSMGTCSIHKSPKQFWCTLCKLWICGTCTFLSHQNSNCKAVIINDPVAVDILIKNELTQLNSQKVVLLQVSKFLEECIELNYSHIVNNSKTNTKDIFRTTMLYLSSKRKENNNSMEILEDAYTEIEGIGKMKTLNDWRNIIKYIKNLWYCQEYPKHFEDILEDFWNYIVNEGKILPWIKHISKKLVFVDDGNGEKRETFGTFYENNNIFMLPSLKHCMDNPRHCCPISFLFSDISEASKYTFMKLSENDEHIGTIIFKLFERFRSYHFRSLCTGELGPCYKGTKFFNDGGNYNCFLAGGDYEFNNGLGGKCLYPFTDDFATGMKEGLVCGNRSENLSQLSQFKVFYNCAGIYQSQARGVMAEVVQGLHLIKEIARSENFNNVIIEECGVAYFLKP